jgi:hypothetical protein
LRLDADLIAWFKSHAHKRTGLPDKHNQRIARVRGSTRTGTN